MIWALHFHRLPIGDQDHQSLPYEAARAIAALLYLIRDGPLPKSSKRNTHDERKALVARELIVTFRLAKPDAIGAAYFDEIEAARKRDDPTKVIEACTRRFERHAAAISSLEGRRRAAASFGAWVAGARLARPKGPDLRSALMTLPALAAGVRASPLSRRKRANRTSVIALPRLPRPLPSRGGCGLCCRR